MNMTNEFDILLKDVYGKYCLKLSNELRALDTTGFEITPAERKRFLKMKKAIEKGRCKKSVGRFSLTKLVAAACLIVLSLAITACVAIPEVRNAIKRIVLSWNDDYVAIAFVEENETNPVLDNVAATKENDIPAVYGDADNAEETPKDSEAPENTEIVKPTSIEKKAYASYLPGDYTMVVDGDIAAFYSISYYHKNEIKFYLSQNIIKGELKWADYESRRIEYKFVNGFQAILFIDEFEPNLYLLIWQDNEYEYNLEGYFENVDELIKVAEGIKLK